jgi:hypothetical protein
MIGPAGELESMWFSVVGKFNLLTLDDYGTTLIELVGLTAWL